MESLLQFAAKGIYCQMADVYIDPWQPVSKALITHGHSDHARPGHGTYLTHHLTKPVIKYRFGVDCRITSVDYNEEVILNGVKFSFYPAGHLPGSAQIRVEYKGEVWVVSGDYKLEDDGLSEPFEPVKCHTFITECTFGLPVYKWKDQHLIGQDINDWWISNREKGQVSVLAGYALGKAQRLIKMLDPSIGKIYTHGAVENINEILRQSGVPLPDTIRVTSNTPRGKFAGNIVITTPSGLNSPWINHFRPYVTAIASGWMSLRGARRRRAVDRGFVVSDHADWLGLNEAIRLSGAERVICTHGYTSIFSQWLNENGIWATRKNTEFEGELSEIGEGHHTKEETG